MWEVRRAPVNPPSPAFRGVRGLRRTKGRAAGPLARSPGLRSRPSNDKPQAGRRVRRIYWRATGAWLPRCDASPLRLRAGVFEGSLVLATKPDLLLVIQCFFVLLPPCRARPEIRIYDNFILLSNTGLDPVQNLVLPRSAEPKHSTPEQKRTDQRQCRAPPVKHTQGLHSALRVTTKQQP